MTTQQIRYFLELARCLSFTKAAHNLYVSQPTLSKQIAQMESELGIKLFHRSGRSISLTSAGLIMRRELKTAETIISQAMDEAQRVEKGSTGHLTCHLLDLIDPEEFFFPVLRDFQCRYPDVEVEMMVGGFRDVRQGLTNGTVDLAFGKNFDLRNLEDVDRTTVYSVTPSVLLPEGHPLSGETKLTLDRMREEHFIVLALSECDFNYQSLVDGCFKLGFYPKISKFANSNTARIYYVHQGYGVTLIDGEAPLPSWFRGCTVPTLMPTSDVWFDTDIDMAWRKDANNPTIALFRDIVAEHMQRRGRPHEPKDGRMPAGDS